MNNSTRVRTASGGCVSGPSTAAPHADFSEQIFNEASGHPAVALINGWGFRDRAIWLAGGGPAAKESRPNPACFRRQKLIQTDWITKRLARETAATGRLKLRGFNGGHRVEAVAPEGTVKQLEFHLPQSGGNVWTSKL